MLFRACGTCHERPESCPRELGGIPGGPGGAQVCENGLDRAAVNARGGSAGCVGALMSNDTSGNAHERAADAVPEQGGALGRLVARLVPRERHEAINVALAAGRARLVERVELLAPERLGDLARWSVALLLAGAVGFGALEWAALVARRASGLPGVGGTAARAAELVVGNVLLYLVVLPVHEAIHGVVILALGGRPRFGWKLPLALYCTAPGQLFTRAGYTAVALAPLAALSVAGGAAIWLNPQLGAYLLLALVGNVSGAVGDLVAALGMRRLPEGTLVADTATGYEAYVVDGGRPT